MGKSLVSLNAIQQLVFREKGKSLFLTRLILIPRQYHWTVNKSVTLSYMISYNSATRITDPIQITKIMHVSSKITSLVMLPTQTALYQHLWYCRNVFPHPLQAFFFQKCGGQKKTDLTLDLRFFCLVPIFCGIIRTAAKSATFFALCAWHTSERCFRCQSQNWSYF